MCRPPRLECKNPRRNAAVYHLLDLGFFRDWTVKNTVFRCSRYVALPEIIPNGRGEGERFVYSCYGDVGHSVSPKLLATTKGTASAAIDVSGASLLVVVAKNNYVGITTAIVPVAALSNNVDTVHLAGGYRASGLYSNYDCRMTLTTFAGRDAYTNGVDRAGDTQWFVYVVL